MRILILHSKYLSGVASGENRVVDDEARLLREAGHEVHVWTPSPHIAGTTDVVKTGASALWSASASAEVKRLIREHNADVAHFHNVFPMLSPASLRAASTQCATVLTLHNYRLMCLPATFLRDGRVCEDCLGRPPWRGVVHRCYRDSLPGSASLASSLILHRRIKTFDAIDLFFAVSRFVKDKHLQAGWPADRITIKPNFAWPSPRREGPGDYFLYLGRFSEEKGIATLLHAWKQSKSKLLVVGAGPQEEELRAIASPRVEFRPPVEASEVTALLQRARALLVPSTCYEGAPRAIIEAFAAGVPVLASRIGGLPEMVVDDVGGRLLEPGVAREWVEAVDMFDDGESERLGDGAYELWRERYSPEKGLRDLEGAYTHARSLT
jgi:glycosyltransferase involved in cell wall biosynthesis